MKFKITKLIQQTHDVKSFWLNPAKGKVFDFKPGHFVNVTANINDETVKRAYSISSDPDRKYIEITVKEVPKGKMSSYLMTLKEGDELELNGPYGDFVYENQDKVILIGGGCAVAPLMSLFRYINKHNKKAQVVFIISARTEEDFIFEKEIKEISNDNSNLHYFITFTRTGETCADGFSGRLDLDKMLKMVQNFKDYHYFISGSGMFASVIKDIMLSQGVDKNKVKIEAY